MKQFGKLIFVVFLLVINPLQGFCFEVRYKQTTGYFILNGKVIRENPSNIITLDIQPEKNVIIYKSVDNLDDARKSSKPDTMWQVVTKTLLMEAPEKGGERMWRHFLSQIGLQTYTEKNIQNKIVLLATTVSHSQAASLYIAQDFFIEVKNSSVILDGVIYQRYERISELSENDKRVWIAEPGTA